MTRRIQRVSEEIRERLAGIVAELKDPRIGFVTVTRVELTDDLGAARVYVGILGEEKTRQETLKVLKGSAGFVRRQLAQRTRLRTVPEILFEYDKGLDAADRVARILSEIGDSEPRD